MRLSNVVIENTASDCWNINAPNQFAWTEALNAQDVTLQNCGGNGLTVDASGGGYFNDSTFINLQVRGQTNYFMKFISGSNANIAAARLTFVNFHGLAGSNTTAQDGIYFQNGGGRSSLSDFDFLGGEIEAYSGTAGFPLNGNATNSVVRVRLRGTTYTNYSGITGNPNVGIDSWDSSSFGTSATGGAALSAGGPIDVVDFPNTRSMTIQLPGTAYVCQGCFGTLTLPPYVTGGSNLVSDNASQNLTNKTITLTSGTFATLPVMANGSLMFCSDCEITNPCNSGGTGALAKRLNGSWVCN
jgi:hypothetical protein